ncbi:hypothetical protein EDB83DRAFT_437408 [Lactarius deliciosus]|nr:hypothetical protein EDB83DRAFT_437408 [Lactarius deliciosus]
MVLLVHQASSCSAWTVRRVRMVSPFSTRRHSLRTARISSATGSQPSRSCYHLKPQRVSFANRRVVVAAGADADAITLGFVELCVNAAANAWSRSVRILGLSLSSSSSSSSCTTTTVSFAAFFVIFPLGPMLPAPGQLFSNATCNTYNEFHRARIAPRPRFPLGGCLALACAGPLLNRSMTCRRGGRGGTRT